MNPLNTLINKASDIIRAASASQLALYALCILVTAVLVVLLFQKASGAVKLGAFIMTLLLMTVGMVLATPRPVPPPIEANWNVNTIDSGNENADTINEKIKEAINGLKPTNITAIKGIIRQDPKPAGDYKVVVFCNSAEGGRSPIKVEVAQANLTHSESAEHFLKIIRSTHGKVVVLGTYHGIQGDSIFYACQP